MAPNSSLQRPAPLRRRWNWAFPAPVERPMRSALAGGAGRPEGTRPHARRRAGTRRRVMRLGALALALAVFALLLTAEAQQTERTAASVEALAALPRGERLIMRPADAAMFAVDARTGRPVESFGDKGRVDLAQGLSRPVVERGLYSNTSPPVIVRDVIVVGSVVPDFPYRRDMPPGDVR